MTAPDTPPAAPDGETCKDVHGETLTAPKYTVKPESSYTDNGSFWMVWDGNKNVTSQVARWLGYDFGYGGVFSSREGCEILCRDANEQGICL